MKRFRKVSIYSGILARKWGSKSREGYRKISGDAFVKLPFSGRRRVKQLTAIYDCSPYCSVKTGPDNNFKFFAGEFGISPSFCRS